MLHRLMLPVVAVAVALGMTSIARAITVEQSTQPALAQTTMPATTRSADSAPIQAEIISVDGIAQYRPNADAKWQILSAGMVLDEAAEIRTGPRSIVRFVIPPDQTFTVDRNSLVKILESYKSGNKVTTRLGMTHGRTRYDIEAAGLEHDGTITSPSATLAMRGTDMVVTDERPFAAQVVQVHGLAEFRDMRRTQKIGARGKFGRSVIRTDKPNAANVSLTQSVIDPSIALARTQAEANLVAALLTNGATEEYDYEKGIKVIKGGQPPTMDSTLIPLLPGRLNFVMRWTGNADINLTMSSPEPNGHTLYPFAGLNTLPSGGHIDFDHRGGPHGGIEIASWPAGAVPAGVYGVGALFISGTPTPATLDVFLDGNRVPIQTSDGMVTTANFDVGPIPPEIASGILAGFVRLSDDQAAAPSQGAKKARLASLKPAAFVGPVAPPKIVPSGRKK